MSKVAIVAGYDRSLIHFRGPLLRALVEAGCLVTACAPAESPEVPGALAAWGVEFRPISLSRTGSNPVADVASYFQLRRIFRRLQPDRVFSYTIKPVIYGSIAARHAGVKHVFAMITGLGSALQAEAAPWVRGPATHLYRRALKHCERVFAQNPDIVQFLIERGLARPAQIVSINGSGVDLTHYCKRSVRPGAAVFLLLARLLREKGIQEYVGAARTLKARFPEVRFILAGATDSNPSAIPAELIQQWQREGVVECLPHQADVRPLLAECTAYVLPSYHEGMPRSVLEAMAVGRAIVTTDTIGCRETVDGTTSLRLGHGVMQGRNGFLVPIKSTEGLVEAMAALIETPQLAVSMGDASRQLAEQKFDVNEVNRVLITGMGIHSKSCAA
jgi:glycosyltransferase involved in cell wall biosynthesis